MARLCQALKPSGRAAFASWPLLRTVQQPNDLDARAFGPINNNKRRPANYQFAGAFLASWAPHLRVLQQHVYLVLDALILVDSGQRVVWAM